MSDWLQGSGGGVVAVESTGNYWNIQEATEQEVWVNAAPVKRVPDRKTDVKDAAFLSAAVFNTGDAIRP
ncbi:MAG: IS110 family transposase [Blastocatellia bacterium]|nr:IS110 family transposase [Blastocatellia bacterium]